MSRLTDARIALHAALATVFDDPVPLQGGGVVQFSADRVHAYPPATVAAPTVWIEQGRGGEALIGERARGVETTLPVAVVYDGADRAQVAGLDELVARVWDAAAQVGTPTRWEPQPLDVGGPTLRATFVDVDMRIGAGTLCGAPTLSKEVA